MGRLNEFGEQPLHIIVLKRVRRRFRRYRELISQGVSKSSMLKAAVDRDSQGVANIGGLLIVWDTTIMGEGEVACIKNGDFEKIEAELISEMLEPEDTLLDLGAGSGFVALTAAKKLNKPVTTVEANSELIPLVEASAKLNLMDLNIIHGFASVERGYTDIPISFGFAGTSAFAKDQVGCKRVERVPNVVVSELISKIKPSVLSVDIEGGEIPLFCEVPLDACVRKICVEVHPHLTGPVTIHNMLEKLKNQGFCITAASKKETVICFKR